MSDLKFKRHSVPVVLENPEYRKVIVAGKVLKVVSMRDSPGTLPIRRVSGGLYKNIYTGQYGEYHKADNKSELSTDSVRRSLERLRLIINANCISGIAVRWVTLTYAENMQDRERLYKDFAKYWKKFLRYCLKNGLEVPEYISVAEPQGRGAWHLHILLVYSYKAPFLPITDISTMWGRGYCWITDCRGVDNIGAYFSSYLADLPIEDAVDNGVAFSENSVVEKEVIPPQCTEKQKKKFVKGARLKWYPSGMNLYRCSRGIVRPFTVDVSDMTEEDWQKEKAGWGEPTFSKSCSVYTSDLGGGSPEVNVVACEYYNRNT